MKRFTHSRKLILAAAAVVLIAAGIFFIKSPNQEYQKAETIDPQSTAEKKQVTVSEIRSGWWETRREIYYEIPARIRFHLPEENRLAAEKIAESAWKEFERIGNIFHPSDPDSETSRLNAADKRDPAKVSEEMFAMLKLCKRLWDESGGAFDPTAGPIKKLWQDAVKTQKIPSKREITGVLAQTGFKHVRLLPQQTAVACDKRGIKFDFGGIAKGFAVDRVVAVLKDFGIPDGLVQLGGEIAAFGVNHGGGAWRIGIQHPEKMREIWGTISAHGKVRVSTSGNYRQPLRIRGHEFYHIFSPETGRPVSQKVLGVTIAGLGINHGSALLDGAATAITVMGRKKGMDLAEKLDIQGLVLSRKQDGSIKESATPGFSECYKRAGPRKP